MLTNVSSGAGRYQANLVYVSLLYDYHETVFSPHPHIWLLRIVATMQLFAIRPNTCK